MYYGHAEVQLLFEQALRGTVSTGRPVKIQDNAIMAMSMYTGVRPSSLTAPYTEYLDERRYLICGDFTIHRIANGSISCRIEVDIRHSKGWAIGAYSKLMTFVFEPVTKSHNVMFEPQLWILAHLWCRGAFGAMTLDELMFGDEDEIEIIPEMRDQPVFVKADAGGRHLLDGEPVLSARLTASISSLARNAGLQPAGLGAFRKEVGNIVGRDM